MWAPGERAFGEERGVGGLRTSYCTVLCWEAVLKAGVAGLCSNALPQRDVIVTCVEGRRCVEGSRRAAGVTTWVISSTTWSGNSTAYFEGPGRQVGDVSSVKRITKLFPELFSPLSRRDPRLPA